MPKPRGTVGASDVAALFNESPYESRYSLWARECGLRAHEDDDDTERLWLGRELEQPLIGIWARREHASQRLKFNTLSMTNPAIPGCSATPDAWFESAPLANGDHENHTPKPLVTIEGKTVQPHERNTWLAGIPRHYWWQVQTQTMICNTQNGYLVALFGVNQLAATLINADKEAHQRIKEEVSIFWKQVNGELPPPPVDDHRETYATILGQPRQDLVVSLDDSEEARDYDRDIGKWNDEAKKAKGKLNESKSRLINLLGAANTGVWSDGSGYRVQTISPKGKKPYKKLVRFSGDQTEEGEDE